ncbi:MAG: DUF5702 domain-containing protein [Oscillospiraceae bacterium]|nr:DUF5702 domain-containing protein [Oscillospiraceae bacterium]
MKLEKLKRDMRGAVTVFITLLLIPAILVSGTAVDLARLHTARSILEDSNQLAANSVLTQYNALLFDLYGLFGVAKDDQILADLLDEYISVSVFGETSHDRTLGTLQLFYGADLELDEPMLNMESCLDNEAVLRRQIEEYMKLRGPVIIVKEILDALDDTNFQADRTVVSNKTEIDARILDLCDKYKELYNTILLTDKIKTITEGIAKSHFGTMSAHLKRIREQFFDLRTTYYMWELYDYPEKADYAAKYTAILYNIRALTIGGSRGRNWVNGAWMEYGGEAALIDLIESAKQNAHDFKVHFDNILRLAQEIDAINEELTSKVDELEHLVNSGQCSDALRIAMTEKTGTPPKSLIERYREILRYDDITSLATVYCDGGYNYIDNIHIPMLEDIRYRHRENPSSGSLTLEQLENIHLDSSFRLSDTIPAMYSRANYFGSIPEEYVTYKMLDGFVNFVSHSREHRSFYNSLKEMRDIPDIDPVLLYDEQEMEDEEEDAEESQRKLIQALLELVNTAYNGLRNKPLGAMYINDSTAASVQRLGITEILTLIPEALNDPVIDTLENPRSSLSDIGGNILLLTYCASVFSNYTTARPDTIGKTREELSSIILPNSITGIPMSPKVNYFFQSEWEYLYHGSQNASENLSAVTRLIFLVRLVCNYITVFGVSEVTAIVTKIQTAFSWSPPLALLLGELARGAFVAAETVVDVAALRCGYKVPLVKNVTKGEWLCSPSGVKSVLANITTDETGKGVFSQREKGLSYSQYMLCLFGAKMLMGVRGTTAEEIAVRAGNLIEWNMINYQSDVNANEIKMAEALAKEDGFRLSNMITGFSLSSSANMRMLFLSMPIARRGIGSIVPPETMTITATDYRGY